jgi:peptidyl-prolyl cis-trans isomerase C
MPTLYAKAGDALVATVNGSPIYESRIAEQLEQIPNDLMKDRQAEVRRELLDRVIDQELVAQEAKRLNIESDAEYKKQLKLTMLQLQANAVVARKVAELVSPSRLRLRYEQVKSSLAFPAVKAKHILVKTEDEALSIIKIATPSNFASLAASVSTGPSAKQGGDLGWFRREAMIPEFAQVAFSTPVGQVAKVPVKTDFGWHVVLVEERTDRYIPPFEQVEPQLRQDLAKDVVDHYVAELRKSASIRIVGAAR